MEKLYKLPESKRLDESVAVKLSLWQVWTHRYKSRKQLNALLLGDSERLHHDLGISYKAALVEINKPFWRR